ncbi:TPA: hypothetical protein RQO06_002950 [Klebsiella michiganensis]|nr:hypothetical protein [Klebsiella michiganensis]HDX8794958.1 hypothetical protein [Klebsiella michiganensis]
MDAIKWAVINVDGIVVNIIVWDGSDKWLPPEGMTVIKCGDTPFSIGGSYKNGIFTPPALSE